MRKRKHLFNELAELVLAEIQSVVKDYKKNPKAFEKKMQRKFQSDSALNARRAEKRLSEITERLAEIEVYIQHLYEDKIKGNVTQDVFANLTKKYSDEKAELFAEREMLKRGENERKQFVKRFNHFIAVVENIENVSEVNPDILRELIDKIEVFEDEQHPESRKKSAKIKVYFTGIGALN